MSKDMCILQASIASSLSESFNSSCEGSQTSLGVCDSCLNSSGVQLLFLGLLIASSECFFASCRPASDKVLLPFQQILSIKEQMGT